MLFAVIRSQRQITCGIKGCLLVNSSTLKSATSLKIKHTEATLTHWVLHNSKFIPKFATDIFYLNLVFETWRTLNHLQTPWFIIKKII